MLDALGCPALPNSRGRSVLPLLAAKKRRVGRTSLSSEFCQDAAGAGGPFPAEGIFQRMIRRGPWKLNYYHGQPCQLFDLQADPRECCDLAADPAHQETLAALKAEVLDGWDPEWIAARMAALRADRPILAAWGRTVQPPDQCRWKLDPAMDYLDSDQLASSQRNTNK